MRALLLSLVLSVPALAFDEAAFGARLNGWTRDGSAHYALDGQRYHTSKPVVTASPDGGETVRVTVFHHANSWAEVPIDLEVVFGSDGRAQSFRITGNPRGKKVDTGLVTRTESPDPEGEMRKQLFESFESQVFQAAEAKDTRKRDLLARIYGPEPIDVAALSAGLRYNLDLILRLPASVK